MRAPVAAGLAVLAVAACTKPPSLPGPPVSLGHGDAGAAQCSSDDDCAFGEQCRDGLCAVVGTVPGDVGCQVASDCPSGSSCALSTGKCVPDASNPPAQPGPPGPCGPGETRTCGTKIGACEYGTETCTDQGQWSGDCVGGRGPVAETCNAKDDDCDGVVDNGFVLGSDCTAGLGVCAQAGFVVCSADGASTTCSVTGLDPTGRTELCGNGLDDDCNGQTDDGFPNLDTLCTVGTGACQRSGDFVCAGDGHGTVCNATPGAPGGAELCGNGVDDNCDGRTDEGFEQLGQACTIGSGACATPGHLQCSADKLSLECVPDNTSSEVCNGVDDNGNGCVDEGFPVGQPCSAGTGACRRTGQLVCNAAGDGTVCDAVPGAPSAEVCGNNVDEDCDGSLDNGFPIGAPCTVGTGACQRSGVLQCSADGKGTVCSAVPGTPSAEKCGNAIDEDCDGKLDDGFDIGAACTAGLGICQRAGVKQCSADGSTTVCNAVPGAPNPLGELCGNGLDDNCNGVVDEGFVNLGSACSNGIGQCLRSGTFVCSTDRTTTTCNAVPGAPSPEKCDNIDNDCNGVVDNGCDDDGDGFCDATLTFVGPSVAVCPNTTGASTLDCNDNNAAIHPGATEICANHIDDNCNGQVDEGCPACNPAIDADFDGFNECQDCNDHNGAVHPGATEVCDGIDNNCDGNIDEGFDRDGDGFTTCGTKPGGGLDPALKDCDDTKANVHPGACELCANNGVTVTCGATNNGGNGVDENCNGFVDEGCSPCSNADNDHDGFSQCQGDCNDNDATVHPGAPEICDGKDNDCNKFTVDNCGVGDKCNFDGDGNPANDPDVCTNRLICVEALAGNGHPSGNFSCTSLCNTTSPGLGLNDSCDTGQTCSAGLTPTADLHGCAVNSVLGTKADGLTCSGDSQCRSGTCTTDRRFAGPAGATFCQDACGSDAYCANGEHCQAGYTSLPECWPLRSFMTVGYLGSCSSAGSQINCIGGPDTCVTIGGAKKCSQVCCSDGDCPSASHCALAGVEHAGPNGGVDLAPICLPDTTGNGQRPSGAACTSSAQCAGEFCDQTLGVCFDVCCNDTDCPTGQECDSELTTLADGNNTFAKMCVSSTPAQVLKAK